MLGLIDLFVYMWVQEPMIFGDYELAVRRINEELEDPRLYQDLGSFARIRKIFDEVPH